MYKSKHLTAVHAVTNHEYSMNAIFQQHILTSHHLKVTKCFVPDNLKEIAAT